MTDSTTDRAGEELPLGRWLDAVASHRPLPAGGRVAAITLTFGAALVEKIGRIVLRSTSRAALHPAAAEVVREAAALRPIILGIGLDDDRAYEALMAARKEASMPQSPAPALAAARVQLPLIERCADVVRLAGRLENGVGPALGADLATACHLARAAARAARGNLEADIKGLIDEAPAAELTGRANAAMDKVLGRVTPPG